ncbi:hypothetical protein [Nocardia brasiliensis]|uniref:hypothetical protein n=1 Tax=Nocardia brasiliensis TaxID=37326 RepID=UPI00367083EE
MSTAPDQQQWSAALADHSALLLCFEAVGYARGYCDAAGLGSRDAIDFGHSFAVLVAARGSRPSIQDTWQNWRNGKPLNLGGKPGPPSGGSEDRFSK